MSRKKDVYLQGERTAYLSMIFLSLSQLNKRPEGKNAIRALAQDIQKRSGAPEVQREVARVVHSFYPEAPKTITPAIDDAISFGIVCRGMFAAIEQGKGNEILNKMGLVPGGDLAGRPLIEEAGFYIVDAIRQSKFSIRQNDFLPEKISEEKLQRIGGTYVEGLIPNLSEVMANFRSGLPQNVQSTLLQDSRADNLVDDAFLLGFIRAGNPNEPAGGASTGPGKGPSTPPEDPAGDREPKNPISPNDLGGAAEPLPSGRPWERAPLPVRRTPNKEEVSSR